jgi:large subunit ribosomal protein L1
MDSKIVLAALQQMRDQSKQRKFKQAVECGINFKGIDFNKSENRIDLSVPMPFATGKGETRVLVFAKDKEFITKLKDKGQKFIAEEEISKISKKDAAKLAEDYDLLLAEGPVMITVGKFLGQQLAPKGKLPKPIQPTIAAVDAAAKQVKGALRITNKKGKFMPVVQARIGNEEMKNEELSENFLAIYNAVLQVLPGKEQNIKSSFVKLSMGPIAKIGAKPTESEAK